MAGREADGCHLTFIFRDPAEFALAFVNVEIRSFTPIGHDDVFGNHVFLEHSARAFLVTTDELLSGVNIRGFLEQCHQVFT
jgi:hypothetical protein